MKAEAPGAWLNAVEDRYDRQRLIGWWDQDCLLNATVLVVGAGALGNEAIKNLALLGVGRLIIVDRDAAIEESNLPRSILYGDRDLGQPKAPTAARAAMAINPDTRAFPMQGDIGLDVGLGVFRRVKVALSCLDSRRARLDLGKACWKVGVPMVDAGLNLLDGAVRFFHPAEGPCYECTLGPKDYTLLEEEYSCMKVGRSTAPRARIPATPTIASIIAGIQTQVAVKVLHNLDIDPFLPVRRTLRYYGLHDLFSESRVLPRNGCLTHAFGRIPEDRILELDLGATSSLGELLETASARLGGEVTLDLSELDEARREVCVGLDCLSCNEQETILKPLPKLREPDLLCPACGKVRRPVTRWAFSGEDSFLEYRLLDLGIPALHIVPAVRARDGEIWFLELTRDIDSLFGGALGAAVSDVR